MRCEVVLWCALVACGPSAGPSSLSGRDSTSARVTARTRLEDRAQRLSDAQRSLLIRKLERTSDTTKAKVAALIVPTLKGETIEQLAETTFQAWQLGEHGVLVVIAIQEKQSRIETGTTVERILTDDKVSIILRENLNPHLRQGEFYGGLNETIDAVIAALSLR